MTLLQTSASTWYSDGDEEITCAACRQFLAVLPIEQVVFVHRLFERQAGVTLPGLPGKYRAGAE